LRKCCNETKLNFNNVKWTFWWPNSNQPKLHKNKDGWVGVLTLSITMLSPPNTHLEWGFKTSAKINSHKARGCRANTNHSPNNYSKPVYDSCTWITILRVSMYRNENMFMYIWNCPLKLLSQSRWILILKIKTNQNKQQYFTDNHYQ